MPAPTLTPAAERLYGEFVPIAEPYDADNGYALAHLCQFFAALIDELYTLAFGAETPWGHLLDVETCPARFLPWLGQFVGVEIPDSLPETVARDRVRAAAGQRRGTRESLLSAVQATLTGMRLVRLVERQDGSAWKELVVTRVDETPDTAATEAAMRSDKIIGVVQTLQVSNEPLINEGTREIDAATATATIDTATLADIT